MQNTLDAFFAAIEKNLTITLATASEGSVTMRLVSPVLYQGAILLFTAADSVKYRQLKANPNCCIAADGFFAEATATFRGATGLAENDALRKAYCAKFPDAFDENVAFGGRNAEFLLLNPTRLTGWTFPADAEADSEVPSMPFSIAIP